MERIGCGPTVGRRVGQRIDDAQLLDDRPRPAVRDDHWQRIVVRRPHVNEMNVESVDLGDEVRKRVEPGLAPPPVVVGGPMARELLNRRELDPLGLIGDSLPFWLLGRVDPPPQLPERLVWHIHTKRRMSGPTSARPRRAAAILMAGDLDEVMAIHHGAISKS
jgi:hypothetical protein